MSPVMSDALLRAWTRDADIRDPAAISTAFMIYPFGHLLLDAVDVLLLCTRE